MLNLDRGFHAPLNLGVIQSNEHLCYECQKAHIRTAALFGKCAKGDMCDFLLQIRLYGKLNSKLVSRT